MDPSIPTSRLRLDYQQYRSLDLLAWCVVPLHVLAKSIVSLHVLVGVSVPTRPHHGIVRDGSSSRYRSRTLPRKGCRSLACPRKVSRALHCAPTVSFVGSSRMGYAPCTTVFSWWVGFRLTSRGVSPRTLVYIVCFLWWGTLYVGVVWVTVLWWVHSMWGVHSMWCGADCWGWLLSWEWCGSVSFRLTGVARVPRAVGGWLLVGACLVREFLGMGGSLVVARGWWSVWARALAGLFSGGGWLVGGCGVLKCCVAVWLVGVFMGGGRAIGVRGGVSGWNGIVCLCAVALV